MAITYKGALNGPWNMSTQGGVSTSRKLIYHFNAAESSVQIAQQTEIPDIGTAHPEDAALYLADIAISEPQQGDTVKSGRYEVTLSYVRKSSGQANFVQDRSVAPWDRPPYDVSIGPKEVVMAFTKAYALTDTPGNPSVPVLNTAGDPFEDTTAVQNAVLRFSYNLEAFDPEWVLNFVDTVNAGYAVVCDVGILPGSGLLRNLTFSLHKEYDNEGALLYDYAKVDVEIEIGHRLWSREIMARGLYFLTGGKKERIFSHGATYGTKVYCGAGAIPVDEAQKLTATGGLVAATSTGAYYQTFYDKANVSWGPLSLPSTVSS